MTRVPGPLADLGRVFVPIEPGEKGTRRPRKPEHLYTATDPVFQAYREAGHNYGVACRGDVAVLDADEPDALAGLIDALPKTAWQVSGSRSSEHYFLLVPGLDADIPLDDPETGENIGHVKAAEQSYVVGPGSRHPSGGRYGPLQGGEIATIDEDDLREIIDPYRPDGAATSADDTPVSASRGSYGHSHGGSDDVRLSAHDVVSRRRYPEGSRREHPFHGSDTGANFMIDDGGETWRCWRHDCTGNALHLVGVEQGVIQCGEWKHGGLDTDTWREIFDAARDAGYDLPDFDPSDDVEPLFTAPLERLKHLSPADTRRAAKKRGLDWPSTDEVRDRLENRVFRAVNDAETVVIDAPTGSGKSHTVATTPWLNHAGVTDGRPVIQLAPTRKARDENAAKSSDAGVRYATFKGRDELCPICAGDHDPTPEGEDDPDIVYTVDGRPVSEWIDEQCDGKGLAVSYVHATLAERVDQNVDELVCEPDGTDCPTRTQWNGVPLDDDGNAAFDVIHATHQFAHVPSLRNHCNVVVDEEADFVTDLSHERVRRAVTAFLDEVDAPLRTWESFVTGACRAYDSDAHGDVRAEAEATDDAIHQNVDRDWYLDRRDAHTLAPALARAIWYALRADADENGRRAATVPHEPPRLDARANDAAGWNREWVTVVLDDENTVRRVRDAPDLSTARAVVGLDAYPTATLWQRNVHPAVAVDRLLDIDERRLWRRFERGLTVVQIGDAVRPTGKNGKYVNEPATRTFHAGVKRAYPEYRAAGTAKHAKDTVERAMRDAGIDDPALMHYGEEKSRDDFGSEPVGTVEYCIDPGDDAILDTLAEAGLDATPERADAACDHCHGDDDGCRECDHTGRKRAHGRDFVGPDADTADAVLASVRENHVAQMTGRFARSPDDPDTEAVVFVRTSAVPPGLVDYEMPGVEWIYGEKQRAVADAIRDAGRSARPTAKSIAEKTDVSKRHVAQTLAKLVDAGVVTAHDGAGPNGAIVYHATGDVPTDGTVNLVPDEIANSPVWDTYTWQFAIRAVDTPDEVVATANGGESHPVDAAVDGPPPGDTD